MINKPSPMIDLGDVNIDELLGDISSPMGQQENDYKPTVQADANQGMQGIELFDDPDKKGFDPAYPINPQRPNTPIDMSEPTDLGLPPISVAEYEETGIIEESEWRSRLEEYRNPAIISGLIILFLIFFGPEIYKTVMGPGISTFTQQGQPSSAFEMTDLLSEEAKLAAIEKEEKERDPKDAAQDKLLDARQLGNPYWALPNRLQSREMSVTRLTAAQESRWRAGLDHQFTYQRYKTIQEIRASQIKGAAFLLFEALEQPKFWARMEALFGLAEMGLEVDVDTVDRTIGNARPFLVANYLKRFKEKRPTGGELYIIRQAIRIVDAEARLNILKALKPLGGDINQLYLIAARYDPSRQIAKWLNEERGSIRLAQKNVDIYQNLMRKYLSEVKREEVVMQQLSVEELSEVNILNEVQFFQELIDYEEDSIAEPGEFVSDGFSDLR